ncbi:hypothetical protein [Streptomyces camelliae]|uniref:Uncharacterized protein n=1 Tax=Streptomyces camelliae TaxID=3004093 RepID=A0ABY7P3R4_9ACTN|nr:hypothetical protein [Streptomyces sp. HUAS 2-6]WBO64950.1 hypothetical protein O1G22_19990 [Streptomyces sp. HUAS 2-6]
MVDALPPAEKTAATQERRLTPGVKVVGTASSLADGGDYTTAVLGAATTEATAAPLFTQETEAVFTQ